MGCNTSQEGVQPVENEKEGVESKVKENGVDDKKQAHTVAGSLEDLIKDSAEAAEAATRIQAVFRGHRTRKAMKAGDGAHGGTPAATGTGGGGSGEPTREELEAEFRADDKELCHAATKIQASFRGHMTRKIAAEANTVNAVQDLANKVEETLDIDLTDPDLHMAATKIQASFRGHKVRKETDDTAPKQ